MNGLDYILEIHRREERFAQAIGDALGMLLVIIGYLVYLAVR